MVKRGVLVVAALLAATVPARASIWLGNNAVRPVLRVDARGDALVTWMDAGKRQSLFVPPQGQLYHGGSLAGPDISSRTAVPGLLHWRVERAMTQAELAEKSGIDRTTIARLEQLAAELQRERESPDR